MPTGNSFRYCLTNLNTTTVRHVSREAGPSAGDQWICVDCCVVATRRCRDHHAVMKPRAALKRMLSLSAADVLHKMDALVQQVVEAAKMADVESALKVRRMG